MNFKPKHCLMFLFIFMVMNNLITAEEEEEDEQDPIITRTCASKLELDTCYLESKTVENGVEKVTEFYGKCKPKERCVLGKDAGGVYRCIKFGLQLKRGENCLVNEECRSEICKNKKCSFLNDGELCDGSDQCAYGSRCRYPNADYSQKKVCSKYAFENEQCDGHHDKLECLPYLACGKDNKCVKKYSLEDGTQTVEPEACKSGMAHTFPSGQTICVSDFKVNDGCPNNQKCVITYKYGDMTGQEEPKCTYKSDGETKTCDYYRGSPEMNEYIKLYREKLEELDDDDLKDIDDYDTLDSSKIAKAFYKAMLRIEFLDAEQCVIDYYMNWASQGMISLKKILLIGLVALLI